MTDAYELRSLYWNNEGNSDKIWGHIKTPSGNLFNFWGKRQVVDKDGLGTNGKRPSLSFKKHTSEAKLEALGYQKWRKGYAKQDVEKVEELVPGFTEFFDYALVTARMTGTVMSDDMDNWDDED